MENTKQPQPSMALDQLVSSVMEQAAGFEAGLTEVVKNAINMKMNPLSIAVGCARTMARVGGSTALAQGMSVEQFEKVIRELVDTTLEEMRPNYLKVQAERQAEGVAQ